jgi:hypothetical protein
MGLPLSVNDKDLWSNASTSDSEDRSQVTRMDTEINVFRRQGRNDQLGPISYSKKKSWLAPSGTNAA